MIRQRNTIDHKRKNSQLQLFHPQINNQHSNIRSHQLNDHSKNKKIKNSQNRKQTKLIKKQSPQVSNLDGRSILRLVENSSKMREQKVTVIQDIEDQFSNENFDHSNSSRMSSQVNDQQNSSFFQFGRKSRSSCHKDQKPSPSTTIETQQNLYRNQNYQLTMEEIVQVPDTLSNSRRYDNSNGKFYHFTTMLEMEQTEKKIVDNNDVKRNTYKQHQQIVKNERIQCTQKDLFNIIKKQQTTKNLNKRKQRHPKQTLNKQSIQKERLNDFSTASCNSKKKNKLLLGNKNAKDEKTHKSKQLTKYTSNTNTNKDKQKLTVSSINLANKKEKRVDSQQEGGLKKKSLPMKNKNKSLLKLSTQKLSCIANSRSLHNNSQTSLSYKKPKNSPHNHQPPPNTAKLSLSDKIQLIQQSQCKLQSQYKMLFECVGQLWQNNKITRYMQISQKNRSDIMRLQEEQEKQEGKLGKLKGEILTVISSARY